MFAQVKPIGVQPLTARGVPLGRRAWLVGVTLAGLAGALGLAATGPGSAIAPDLARLLRFMGALKAVFALAAFGVAYWRLGWPAAGWRGAAYVVGPGLAAGGAVLLWTLQPAGPASLAFHAGLFWLVAAALSDPAFPLTRGRTRRAGG